MDTWRKNEETVKQMLEESSVHYDVSEPNRIYHEFGYLISMMADMMEQHEGVYDHVNDRLQTHLKDNKVCDIMPGYDPIGQLDKLTILAK